MAYRQLAASYRGKKQSDFTRYERRAYIGIHNNDDNGCNRISYLLDTVNKRENFAIRYPKSHGYDHTGNYRHVRL